MPVIDPLQTLEDARRRVVDGEAVRLRDKFVTNEMRQRPSPIPPLSLERALQRGSQGYLRRYEEAYGTEAVQRQVFRLMAARMRGA